MQIIKAEVFSEFRDMVERELLVWSAAGNHPYILRLKDVFCSSKRMYFISGEVMIWFEFIFRGRAVANLNSSEWLLSFSAEMCANGSLLGGLATCESYSERDTVLIIRKILEALVHMHGLGLVHCDVSFRAQGSVSHYIADELVPCFALQGQAGEHMPGWQVRPCSCSKLHHTADLLHFLITHQVIRLANQAYRLQPGCVLSCSHGE